MTKSIFILGLRGIPNVQGGIETHVEQLAPLLVEKKCHVTVLARSMYQPDVMNNQYLSVHIKKLWAPKSKRLESLVHTFLGVLYAAIKRPDILHIHAVGPALMVPLARLLGLKVVMTHHGPDYDRQKWGGFAKKTLQLGERFGVRFSNKVIVISKTIQTLVKNKHGIDSELIPNGVSIQKTLDTEGALKQYGLEKNQYILIVSRLVPEKRHFDLMNAFEQANLLGWKLVIVGSSDHPDEYSEAVLKRASEAKNIVATGFLSGNSLKEIFNYAGVFVLPSSHEGLPIALLEALSFGLPVLASDIPANIEVGLESQHYFKLGSVEELSKKLVLFSKKSADDVERDKIKAWVAKNYDWHLVRDKTLSVYLEVFGGNRE